MEIVNLYQILCTGTVSYIRQNANAKIFSFLSKRADYKSLCKEKKYTVVAFRENEVIELSDTNSIKSAYKLHNEYAKDGLVNKVCIWNNADKCYHEQWDLCELPINNEEI